MSNFTTRPGRQLNGSYHDELREVAKFVNSLRISNISKTKQAIEAVRDQVIELESAVGKMLSMRVKKISRSTDENVQTKRKTTNDTK
jgi:hypothetical protein